MIPEPAIRSLGALPDAQQREAWSVFLASDATTFHGDLARLIIARAEADLSTPWPCLTASAYLTYWTAQDRLAFETLYFARRQRLAYAVVASCLTGEQRFATDIADAIWLICEESTWTVPAHRHIHVPESQQICLAGDEPTPVDLFACETAAVLAQTLRLVGPLIDRISPRIAERARAEIRRRVIDPVHRFGDDHWWLAGRNNWTPWCISNCLLAAAEVLPQEDMPAFGALLEVGLGRLLAAYPSDGGCDEGCMYWSVVAGTLLTAYEELDRWSTPAQQQRRWSEPLLGPLAAFPWHGWLGGKCFPTFADVRGEGLPSIPILWRWSERTRQPELAHLGWMLAREGDPAQPPRWRINEGIDRTGGLLLNLLRALWWIPRGATEAPPPTVMMPHHSWLPRLQVLVSRGGDLAVAAKLGHNDENHNHNDVGQVTVWRAGRQLIVDPGVGFYHALSFSDQRYEMWPNRGSDHNVPVINGHSQQAGPQHRPIEVRCDDADDITVMTGDLAGCYAVAAGVRRALRTLRCDRQAGRESVIVLDEVEVADGTASIEINLLICREVQQTQPGLWRISSEGAAVVLEIASEAEVRVLPQPLEDEAQRNHWGSLQRLVLTARSRTSRVSLRWSVRPA